MGQGVYIRKRQRAWIKVYEHIRQTYRINPLEVDRRKRRFLQLLIMLELS